MFASLFANEKRFIYYLVYYLYMSSGNSILGVANKVYVAIIDKQTIVACKSKKDANKVLKLKRYYRIPEPLIKILRRGEKIYHYELYGIYIRISPEINESLIGKVFSFNENEIKDILQESRLIDTYGKHVKIEEINEQVIDEYIRRTKEDLEKIERWKERPKIYYFGDSDIRDKLVEYARTNGKKISKQVYFYEKDDKYMIIDTWNWVGMTLPKNVNLLDYEEEIRDQLKNDYVRKCCKEIISMMLDIPELQEIASNFVLLFDLI